MKVSESNKKKTPERSRKWNIQEVKSKDKEKIVKIPQHFKC